MWYVIQVFTGTEEKTAAEITRRVDPGVLSECFNPRYETQMHLRGEWRSVERPLFPGYVIADTQRPEDLADQLRRVTAFTRILGSDEKFTPLAREEAAWISEFTQKGRRVIGMSEGVIEGDEVIILSGPLLRQHAQIVKINRRKRLAFLNLDLCGRTVTVKVGLAIIKKA